jgi:hypothetical protein
MQVDDFSELQSVTEYDGGYSKDHTTVQQVRTQATSHRCNAKRSVCMQTSRECTIVSDITLHCLHRDVLTGPTVHVYTVSCQSDTR